MTNPRFCRCIILSHVTSLSVLPQFAGAAPEKLSFDYIFQFGDSVSDTGNLIKENQSGAYSICGRFPYGKTFNKSTGRCSDGLLMIDHFAEFFHQPFLRPYLEKEDNFTYGVNFAVAGATALSTSVLRAKGIFSPVTNSSLSTQLDWFKSHLNTICSSISECKQIVQNSLIMMGEIGGNDYNFAILEGKTMEELNGMVPEVVGAVKEALKEVINLGGIRIVVPGNFPIGCLPIFLSVNDSGGYDELGCLRGLNNFAQFHNDHLQQAIKELQQEYPIIAIVYGDYFSALKWILQHAPSLGFDKDGLLRTCCGTGDNKYNFDLTRMCGNEGVPACPNPDQQISWDGIHLTQHAYLHMTQWLLKHTIPGILQVV